jgi:hypothetical protein
MRTAEFEEKEYEPALYNQLERWNRSLWQPGLVLESYLGFDAALFLSNPFLWELHGFSRRPRGLFAHRFRWPLWPAKLPLTRLPRFRVNCFIQAKRPEFGSRLRKQLSALGTTRPYFRFAIEHDQQKALVAAANKLHKRALFTYAAPVFYRAQELFKHMTVGSIVQNSMFPDVLSLKNHSAWYYNKPGAIGIVNPDFELRELASLQDRIETLVRENSNQSERDVSPSVALEELLRELQASLTGNEELINDPRVAFLSEEWRRIRLAAEEIDAATALFSFLGIEAFCVVFNLIWLTAV